MKGRTVREFTYRGDLWPLVEAWANETGFRLLQQEDSGRVYRKGGWLLMAPAFLEIHQRQGRVTLAAWVKADFFLIVSLLTGKKAETGIEAGGLTAAVPRKRARQALNLLLQRLEQNPVG
jgi:hypothetical protein